MIRCFYIVFEGVVGTGKTTQSEKLTQYLAERYPNQKVTLIREPGGTEIAEKIRLLVQGTPFEEEMDPVCETYLYAASRAQTLRRVIKPALDQGNFVVSDRSFITSLVNQGFGRELGVETVLSINQVAIEAAQPDLIIFLDLDPKIGLTRIGDKKGDKFEKENLAFYQKLTKGYRTLAKLKQFKDRWITVKVDGNPQQVFSQILDRIQPFLPT